MTNKRTPNYFLAGVVGAIVGVVGGLLFAPKSGKETREDISKLAKEISKNIKTKADETKKMVKEVWGNVSDEALAKYEEIKSKIASKVATLKTAGQSIDKEKYESIVEEVVSEYKSDLASTKNGASKLVSQLKKDWVKIKKALS